MTDLPGLPLATILSACDLATRAHLSATCTKLRSTVQIWRQVIFARETVAARCLQRVWLRWLCTRGQPLLQRKFPGALARPPYAYEPITIANCVGRSVVSNRAQRCPLRFPVAHEFDRLHYRPQHHHFCFAPASARNADILCTFRLTKLACWLRECFLSLTVCEKHGATLESASLFTGNVLVRQWLFPPVCDSVRLFPNVALDSHPDWPTRLDVAIRATACAPKTLLSHTDDNIVRDCCCLSMRSKTFYVPNTLPWNERTTSDFY